MTTCAKMRRSLVVKVMRQRCATSWCSPGASDTPASRKTCKGPSLSPRRKASNSSGVAMLSRTAPRCFLRHSSSHLWNVLRFPVRGCGVVDGIGIQRIE